MLPLIAAPFVAGRATAAPVPRVVTLDWGHAETLLALGVVPVSVPERANYDVWVVEPALPRRVPDLGLRIKPNLEFIAGLAPDAITIIDQQAGARALYEAIAPTLELSIYTTGRAPWLRSVTATRRLGALVGREAAADRLIAGSEAGLAAARDRLARRERPPLLLVNFLDARHVRVYGAASLFQEVLDRIGLRNAWGGETTYWGYATVGIEALVAADPEARLMVLDPLPPGALETLEASPLWWALPFVRAGRMLRLPPVLMFGMLPAAGRFARLVEAALEADGHG